MNLPATRIVTEESGLKELAVEVIELIPVSKIWAFHGEMGAGKTTMIRTICEQLRVRENVSSPTFALVNEYHSELLNEKIYHFDFYRIENEREAVDIGCEEYFESGCLCLIEWPEKILNLLPRPRINIIIKTEDLTRRITFSYD